ncbi:MAG TPA: hypothetical protein VFY28_01495 [Candidatus Paceibacterota bacterium]|nr:hypothetical protein [Candidatus Paceibacterota bacterium]
MLIVTVGIALASFVFIPTHFLIHVPIMLGLLGLALFTGWDWPATFAGLISIALVAVVLYFTALRPIFCVRKKQA